MVDYVKMIADKLIKEKRPVMLYGAGSDAIFTIHRLQQDYLINPTCVCDSDISKHYKRIQGVEILPLNEARLLYPDAALFVSSRTYKHEIIGSLLENGKVLKEQILNYEPVERRFSCRYLENDFIATNQQLNFCCSDFGKNKTPHVEFRGDYELAAKEFVVLRDKLINDLGQGIVTSCSGCPCLRIGYYPVERKIRSFNYSEVGICNFNCIYCNSSAKQKKTVEDNEIDCVKMFNALINLNLVSEDCTIDLASGEILIHPNRSEMYDLIENRCDLILTNASIYDKRLAEILKRRGRLYISIDAGTRETYAKIKGADLFNRVFENLNHYADTVGFSPCEIKYIFIPGVNDNDADVDGFVEFCKSVGTSHILISYDFHAPDPKETTISAIKRLVEKLNADEMQYNIISDVIIRAMKIRS